MDDAMDVRSHPVAGGAVVVPRGDEEAGVKGQASIIMQFLSARAAMHRMLTEPESSLAARLYWVALQLTVVLALLGLCLSTVPSNDYFAYNDVSRLRAMAKPRGWEKRRACIWPFPCKLDSVGPEQHTRTHLCPMLPPLQSLSNQVQQNSMRNAAGAQRRLQAASAPWGGQEAAWFAQLDTSTLAAAAADADSFGLHQRRHVLQVLGEGGEGGGPPLF